MKSVKYYKGADLAKGHMLRMAVEVYDKLDVNITLTDINIVIELYCISKYVKDGTLLLFLGDEKQVWVKEKSRVGNELIGRFIKQHTNILNEYSNIEVTYRAEFWELVATRVILDKISESEFENFLKRQEKLLHSIFEQDKLVKRFDLALRNHMLDNPDGSTRLLLNKYMIKHLVERGRISIPPSLTLDDKEKIIFDYLDLERPNLNYTRLCAIVQNTAEFKLDDRIKLKAKKVSEKLERELFKEENQLGTEIVVEFKKNVEGTVKQYFTIEKVGTEVDVDWLTANMDNPTVLNNFIHIFEFVDENMVSTFPYNPIETGVFESSVFINYKGKYRTSRAFSLKETLTLFQTHAYYNFLRSNDKHLEKIIEWFFHVYLNEEFGINDFRVAMPPIDSPSLEKSKSIFPTIENILKQYRLFIEDGYIDEGLITIGSKPLVFKDCPSRTKNRYVYLHSDNEEARIVEYLLFSGQSDLAYFEKYREDNHNSLFELLNNSNLYKHDVEHYQEQSLNWLVSHGYLRILDDNQIVLENTSRIYIYYLIHINGVVITSKLPNSLQHEVKRLIKECLLVAESTLLNRQEADYFDYYLNKSKFINGKDLRNAYLHGASSAPENDNEHYTNYLHALKLLITIMIKINDDLCTAEI